MSIDERFSRFLFERTKDSYVLTKFAIFCGSFLIWLMFGLAIGRMFADSLFLIPLVFFPWLVTFVLSRWIKRPRPFESEHYKPIIKLFVYTNSFPSAHSTLAFALAGAFIHDPIVLLIMTVCAVLVGLGRMMVGVHYLTDVLVGALIGFVGGFAFRVLLTIILLYLYPIPNML
ncbi:MAG: phosphatase PAP2 family protein [Patescibacteria group bacterium]